MLWGGYGLPCRLLLSSGVFLCGIARFSSPRSVARLTVALNGMPVALRIRPIHGEGKGGWRRSWTHIEAALEPSRARIVVALRIRPIHGEGKGGWRRSWTHIEAALEPSRARI